MFCFAMIKKTRHVFSREDTLARVRKALEAVDSTDRNDANAGILDAIEYLADSIKDIVGREEAATKVLVTKLISSIEAPPRKAVKQKASKR
jgi:hypothetical protein